MNTPETMLGALWQKRCSRRRMLRRDRDIEKEKADILRREIEIGVEQARRRAFFDRTVKEIAASMLD